MSQGTCKECRFWKVDWDMDLDRCYPVQGRCRINPPCANGFPRAVSSDWCGKFEPLATPVDVVLSKDGERFGFIEVTELRFTQDGSIVHDWFELPVFLNVNEIVSFTQCKKRTVLGNEIPCVVAKLKGDLLLYLSGNLRDFASVNVAKTGEL